MARLARAQCASVGRDLVVVYKKETGRQTTTYGDLIEEALCFGWVDSVIRGIDETCYAHRFTPRKPGSKWSPSNIQRVKRLEAAGQMPPPDSPPSRDMKLSAHAAPDRITAGARTRVQESRPSWRYFSECPPGYRRTTIGWVASAKREETRRRRLAELIATSARGERIKSSHVVPQSVDLLPSCSSRDRRQRLSVTYIAIRSPAGRGDACVARHTAIDATAGSSHRNNRAATAKIDARMVQSPNHGHHIHPVGATLASPAVPSRTNRPFVSHDA